MLNYAIHSVRLLYRNRTPHDAMSADKVTNGESHSFPVKVQLSTAVSGHRQYHVTTNIDPLLKSKIVAMLINNRLFVTAESKTLLAGTGK